MMHVLVVDDSPVMRRFLSRTLEMTGLPLSVHEAENGVDAISKAFEIRPDLIITDLNMPEMNGDTLTQTICRTPELKGTPIIVLSADRSAERPAELLLAGAKAYMTKPISPESLRECLLAFVGGGK
jgi:two-component system chemotaxis response regulator CheY